MKKIILYARVSSPEEESLVKKQLKLLKYKKYK